MTVEHHHRSAPPGECRGGLEAAVAAADHHHVGVGRERRGARLAQTGGDRVDRVVPQHALAVVLAERCDDLRGPAAAAVGSAGTPAVGLLHQVQVREDLGALHAVERADAVVDQLEQVAHVDADDLGEDVVATGGDDDVLGLVELGRARRRRRGRRRSTSMPTSACTANPSVAGSVTATTCMTPRSTRRCTRWRAAACDSPTAGPSFEYGVRPSSCSSRMIALSVSSISAEPPWSLTASRCEVAGRAGGHAEGVCHHGVHHDATLGVEPVRPAPGPAGRPRPGPAWPSATRYGSVALVSAEVDVTGTAPGMLPTQ